MKIEVLYPEICNLFGELMNPEYLARSCGAELVYTSLKEKPKFITEDIALVYMGYTTERGEEAVRDAFRPYLEELKKRTDAGGVTLFTGNIIEVFGEYVEDDGGSKIQLPVSGEDGGHDRGGVQEPVRSLLRRRGGGAVHHRPGPRAQPRRKARGDTH